MSKSMDKILEFNRDFVANGEYEKYPAGPLPEKRLAILTCMDTRLTVLLPAALGLQNGDVKIIKNAGGIITNPFGSVMRSLLICVYEMLVAEIAIIGHYNCGMKGMEPEPLYAKMLERGIPRERIETIKDYGINLDAWLQGFSDAETSVRETVKIVKNHPLMPGDVSVSGWLMDPATGAMHSVV